MFTISLIKHVRIKMRNTLTALSLLSGFAVITLAEEAMPPALYFDSNGIGTDIAASLSQRPSFGVGRINSGDDYAINMIRRTSPAGAIVHPDASEIHYIVEGAGVLTTGGVVVRQEDSGVVSSNIEGGYSRRVSVGDLVLIPTDTPHQYTAVEGVVGYLEVRFETSEY